MHVKPLKRTAEGVVMLPLRARKRDLARHIRLKLFTTRPLQSAEVLAPGHPSLAVVLENVVSQTRVQLHKHVSWLDFDPVSRVLGREFT